MLFSNLIRHTANIGALPAGLQRTSILNESHMQIIITTYSFNKKLIAIAFCYGCDFLQHTEVSSVPQKGAHLSPKLSIVINSIKKAQQLIMCVHANASED